MAAAGVIKSLMRRVFITVAVWMAGLMAQAQAPRYERKKLSVTEVQTLYSHYLQDGVHSAVTGGQGTENLKVYAPSIRLMASGDSAAVYAFQGGADVITSASTDKIDFVVSSASRVDYRGYGTLSADRSWKSFSLGASVGLSMESDYFSRQFGLRLAKTNADESRTLSLSLQTYFDDLRWGRVNPDYYRPVRLIYPSELRNRQWFTQTNRNSFNLGLALNQIVNRRTIIRISAGVTLQKGLLSTPFHRVYFADTAYLRVEKLPSTRWRIPLGAELRYFAGQRIILKLEPTLYWDNFGIRAAGILAEGVVKLNPMLSVSIFGRFYTQEKSRYFKPYAQHTGDQTYYTSDYDLAQIQTMKIGAGLRYAPYASWGKRLKWKEVDLRYSYYRRSDTLHAHILSVLIGFAVSGRG